VRPNIDPMDIAGDVAASARGWRQTAAILRAVREDADRDPADVAAMLIATTHMELPRWQARVEELLAEPRIREAAWQREFSFAHVQYATWRVAEASIRYAIDLARDAGEDPAGRVVEKVLAVLEATPTVVATAATAGPDDSERGRVTTVLAGYVRSRLHLGRNRRLAAARDAVGGEAGLLERLPAATLVAWVDRDAGEPMSMFINRTARLLEAERGRDEQLDPSVDFAAQETVRTELRERAERAGLSVAEGQVFGFFLEGLTETEIAARRRVSVGTVRKLMARAKVKIRAA
jgi:DNA-binding CsgD family transcriptional regulator